MADAIYLFHAHGGSLIEATRLPYAREKVLQDLLNENPQLIPGAQITPTEPRRWLVLRSLRGDGEPGVPSEEGGSDQWALDHLLVDQDAIPTLVEVKQASNREIRRQVVAQMLEYAANGTAYWHVETLRGWFEERERGAGHDPTEALRRFLEDEDADPDEFWDNVAQNLALARVRCIFVAESIPATLKRLVEFLNEHLDTIEVLAVEIPQYISDGEELGAFAPRLIGQTSKAQAVKAGAASGPQRSHPWTYEETLDAIRTNDPSTLATAERIVKWATACSQVEVRGGRGRSYPSFTAFAPRTRGPSMRGLLGIYGARPPYLDVRVKAMLETPPFRDGGARTEFLGSLIAAGIVTADDDIPKAPNRNLTDVTSAQLEHLLRALDTWIEGVTAASESES